MTHPSDNQPTPPRPEGEEPTLPHTPVPEETGPPNLYENPAPAPTPVTPVTPVAPVAPTAGYPEGTIGLTDNGLPVGAGPVVGQDSAGNPVVKVPTGVTPVVPVVGTSQSGRPLVAAPVSGAVPPRTVSVPPEEPKSKLMPILIMLVLAAVLAVVLFFVLGGNKEDDKSNSPSPTPQAQTTPNTAVPQTPDEGSSTDEGSSDSDSSGSGSTDQGSTDEGATAPDTVDPPSQNPAPDPAPTRTPEETTSREALNSSLRSANAGLADNNGSWLASQEMADYLSSAKPSKTYEVTDTPPATSASDTDTIYVNVKADVLTLSQKSASGLICTLKAIEGESTSTTTCS